MFLEKEREEFLKLFCLWRRLRGGGGGGGVQITYLWGLAGSRNGLF